MDEELFPTCAIDGLILDGNTAAHCQFCGNIVHPWAPCCALLERRIACQDCILSSFRQDKLAFLVFNGLYHGLKAREIAHVLSVSERYVEALRRQFREEWLLGDGGRPTLLGQRLRFYLYQIYAFDYDFNLSQASIMRVIENVRRR